MTVEELVQELQQYDASAEVRVVLAYDYTRHKVVGVEASWDDPDYDVYVNVV